MGAYPSQSGRYPVAVICVDVLPSDVDVNLEPNKTTVLFHNMVSPSIVNTSSRELKNIASHPKAYPREIGFHLHGCLIYKLLLQMAHEILTEIYLSLY